MDIKNPKNNARFRHALYLIGLMLAGESIYLLPYLRKTFQTSMEVVFQLSSTEVGYLNAMFGILAVLGYFPSGWLADRVSARKLLSLSLVATSAGGFFMFTIPSYPMLLVLHAFWGVFSIFTFWAALIKATRQWGSSSRQGTSFGLLDGGRGAVAAVLATAATAAFASSTDVATSLKKVLLIYSMAPLLTAALIWWVIPEGQYASRVIRSTSKKPRLRQVLRLPQVWWLAGIIFCSYMLYVGTFDFPAYAERGYGQSKTFGAVLGTVRDWMRPLSAIGAGLLADRYSGAKIIGISFGLLIISLGGMGLLLPSPGTLWLLWVQALVAALATFALRGVYFALLEQTHIPISHTGLAVGLVSFIGFTPDIFSHALSGWFVDSFSGSLGYRYYFGLLAAVAVLGMYMSWRIAKYSR